MLEYQELFLEREWNTGSVHQDASDGSRIRFMLGKQEVGCSCLRVLEPKASGEKLDFG
jgi:hypothetical protein